MTEDPGLQRAISRRTLLSGVGGIAVGAAVGAGLNSIDGSTENSPTVAATPATVAFYGDHQAGISTPTQHYLHFASFDVTATSRSDLRAMLQAWTNATARMTTGQTAAPLSGNPLAPPEDTGEGLDLPPSRLTVTFGFGPGLFTAADGSDPFGLAAKRPAALVDIPQFKNDNLEAARSGGDICVQACADDPQVAFHAVRNLARIGRGAVAMRWSQLGFSRASAASHDESTPRNLMGFKDGTNNIQSSDALGLDRYVWAGGEGGWMQRGSYLVARRIRMRIETWDRSPLSDQENTIGRAKLNGAPLGQRGEFDTVDLKAVDAKGGPAVPIDAHIRLAAPVTNNDERILRRGYSFTDGMDAYGELDAGLFFIAFQRDPRTQFIPIQQRLAASDALNEYISHTGSAIFACPPGIGPGGWIGGTLLG